MTLTADSKKRVVIPGASPGDVFACEKTNHGIVLKRIYSPPRKKKLTKAQALKAILNWRAVPNTTWEALRKVTREL